MSAREGRADGQRRRNDLSTWGRTEACPDMTAARGSAASLSRILPTRIVPKPLGLIVAKTIP
jgi:hypothetical protein